MITTEFVNHADTLGNLVCLQKTSLGTCTVRQLNNLRWLLINNTLQSICNVEHPEYFLLPHLQQLAALWEKTNEPKSVLEVGLGGGVIRNFIVNKFPQCGVTTIEKSSEVIALYQQYFAKENGQNIINADITKLEMTQKFDWIVLDLFSQQDCPIFLFQSDFYEKIKAMFENSNNRHLFINFICESKQQLNQLHEVLHKVFEVNIAIYPIENYNNKIVHLHF